MIKRSYFCETEEVRRSPSNWKLTRCVRVSEALVEHLSPLRERINYYLEHRDHLDRVFRAGNETAQEIAQETMASARRAVGFTS